MPLPQAGNFIDRDIEAFEGDYDGRVNQDKSVVGCPGRVAQLVRVLS